MSLLKTHTWSILYNPLRILLNLYLMMNHIATVRLLFKHAQMFQCLALQVLLLAEKDISLSFSFPNVHSKQQDYYGYLFTRKPLELLQNFVVFFQDRQITEFLVNLRISKRLRRILLYTQRQGLSVETGKSVFNYSSWKIHLHCFIFKSASDLLKQC